MSTFSFSFANLAYWFNLHWLPVAAIVVIAYVALRFGTMLIEKVVRRAIRSNHYHGGVTSPEELKKRQDTLIGMFCALWRVGVWTVASLTMLKEIAPFDTTAIFASAGIIGIALGFGAQSIIKDLLTGIFIIMENQYRVGDVVDLQGIAVPTALGTVEKITIRSTILRDLDGNVHYLANGNVMHVVNKTMGFSKINFSLAVAPNTDIDKLATFINEIGDALKLEEKWAKKIIEAPHFVSIGSFSDTALEVKITGTTQPSEQWKVTGELRKRLLATFKKNKIELAELSKS
ncbi:MAG TPA: mechanosensitive ion channel family protein [Candidatus Saccharimonadales bacterium]|jgi:small conductance mechanosensitive channel|nr:mechanosensitive ion channel family protein [Candidatus Saccharimonadales bacterium]